MYTSIGPNGEVIEMVLDKTIVDNQVSPGIQQLFLQTALGTMTTAKGNGTLRPYLEAEY